MASRSYTLWCSCLFALVLHSCADIGEQEATTLFKRIPETHSKLSYKTSFVSDPNDMTGFNTGAGVSAGDINNDGLPDLLFAGGEDSTRLYINKGKLTFEDITTSSGIFDGVNKGRTDAAFFVDINGDGWLDIYMMKYGIQGNAEGTYFTDYGSNLLFVNQKNMTFVEQAAAYGLNINGYTVGVNFFDYDNDGDLDVIMLNNPDPGNSFDFAYYSAPRLHVFNNRLFENMGGRFVDVTATSGIPFQRCIGQSVSVADVNNDGWTDIYIANDFFGKDYLFINNQDKTFTDQQAALLPKSTLSSMGSDFADINGDGWLDLFSGEMLPEDPVRRKMNVVPFSSEIYGYMESKQMAQYPRNMLQLNMQGKGFKDIGFLAGVEATEWSWGSLFADFDNDGKEDLFVTNGIKRDITNMDFVKTNYGTNYPQMADPNYKVKSKELLEPLPSLRTPNYMFKNNGDLTFSNITEQWGLEEPVHSRGVAYADLDNDGDLDLIINNMDTKPHLYENRGEELLKRNYLKIRLIGASQNTFGVGARAYVYCANTMQMKQLSCIRGFASSPEPLLHFGIDTAEVIDSVRIVWPGGKSETKLNPKVNKLLIVSEKDAHRVADMKNIATAPALFTDISTTAFKTGIVHKNEASNDFKSHRLLYRMYSKELPAVATADVNGDGREDFCMRNSWEDKDAQVYLQQADGGFNLSSASFGVASLGKFSSHISCMAPFDVDNDHDVDWFVNDRIDYANYPKSAGNYLLRNDNGTLTDITNAVAPGLHNCGLITCAVWTDYNGDGKTDLVVAGEWMPVTIFKNTNGKLVRITQPNGLENATGWWSSIAAADFDKDGDMDFVAGNFGLNSVFKASPKEPVTIYAADFDNNGTNDPLLFHYLGGKNVPFVNRDLLCEQMPSYNNKFYTFENYAKAELNDIISEEQRKNSLHLNATTLASVYIENKGNGSYAFHPLPNQAQLAPMYGVQAVDANGDGHLDIVVSGNSYANHYEYGNLDGLGTLLLAGDGKGKFNAVSAARSGLHTAGDAKGLVRIPQKRSGAQLFVVPQNNDVLKVFRLTTAGK